MILGARYQLRFINSDLFVTSFTLFAQLNQGRHQICVRADILTLFRVSLLFMTLPKVKKILILTHDYKSFFSGLKLAISF